MNNENLNFLRDSIRYLGFGEAMANSEPLEEEMKSGVKEFQLRTAACFDEYSTIQATLYFRRSENFDMYFLNKYDASLVYDNNPNRNKMQTFYISKGRGVTFKEAFNLLQGRAVYKNLVDADGTEYNAWLQLSFSERTPSNANYRTRHFGERYGYDLEKALSNYPIRELQDEQLKQNLLYSLRKGNIHPVTFTKANKIEKMYIEACPEYKMITIHSELTRAAHKPPSPKADPIKSAPLLFPDPEGPAGNGEKEEEKNEEKDPPADSRPRINGSPVRKRSRASDSL
ncbi:MAG TPA: hypothetical protein VHD83_06530 [Puia sp.]|nr:hypothetical protein [Puia sp.]